MDTREALGSWIDGPKSAAEKMGADFGFRGERLGLPREGSGSIAGPGRRLGALVVDSWLVALISFGLITRGSSAGSANMWTTPLLFTVIVLMLATTGTTVGKRLFGLRVVRLDGGRATIPQVLLRTALLFLVVPALVWDRDTRGLHDKAVGTVEVRI
ncbi:RDD family protein [Kitasatospora purpeofusca]|uniref:RDD family protein n=1 Tax=Kitasatospora purpeofusca TaxID=67352 RepID=UPI002A5AE569|nr:RDD family protein [Kitasatospora purpeofusca]MDY0809981.1 RDD family protein [Kitasatospora purpeofusca]